MRRSGGILAFALSIIFLGAQATWAVVVTKGAVGPDRTGTLTLPLEENADAVALLESIDRNCTVTEGATLRADDAVVDGQTLTIPFEGAVPPGEVALDCPDWLATAPGLGLPILLLAGLGTVAAGGIVGGLFATDVIGDDDDDDDDDAFRRPPASP